MKALSALRSPKIVVDAGKWHNGKIPRDQFPLSHTKPHRLGKAWNWIVYRVDDVAGEPYRLLVAYEPMKRQYFAWLGAVYGTDQALLARVEFHASHDGWHCHWKTGPLAEVGRGAVKAGHPHERRHHCGGSALDLSHTDARTIAFKVFNVVGNPLEGLV